MNQPWECPRCNKINAPWREFCDCKKEHEYHLVDENETINGLDKDIFDMFIVRTTHALKKANIKNISELINLTELELSRIPNLGMKSIREIKSVLSNYNLFLRSE